MVALPPLPTAPHRAPSPPASPLRGPISRRSLLALAGAALAVAACGGDDEGGADGDGAADPAASGPGTAATGGDFVVVQRYPNTALTPGALRLPISIAQANGALLESGPDTLPGRILDASDVEVATFDAQRHGEGLTIPYWSVTANLTSPGIYFLAVDGAAGEPTPFQLFDPAEVAVATPGAALEPFDTPTLTDARGVDPICTRAGDPCPFHEVTLTEALAAGLPVVYMIGTPEHCATATCAPGLEFLIELAPEYEGRATFVHAEVYTDSTATTVTEAVAASGLDYEPTIWITDATGTVRERIDIVWDAPDLSAALARSIS